MRVCKAIGFIPWFLIVGSDGGVIFPCEGEISVGSAFWTCFFWGAAERTVDAGWRIVEMEIVSEARKHSYSRNLNN